MTNFGKQVLVSEIDFKNVPCRAYDLIGRIFLGKDDEVWLEDPCYFGAGKAPRA